MSRIAFICAVTYLCLLAGISPAGAADKSICSDPSFATLNDDGSLKECTLKDKYLTNGVKCNDFSAISFYNADKLESCILAEHATVGDKKCQANGKISFFENGKLKQCLELED